MKRKLLLFFIFLLIGISTSQAILFERRHVESYGLNLFTFPIVGNIPGVQSFYGLGVTLGGVAKTDFAASGFFLRGEVNENFDKHGDGGDFGVNILVATDIPISKFIFPNSAIAATERLKNAGAKNICFICLLAAPEGIANFQKEYPEIKIYTVAIDKKLNEKGYILPGLGDAGDRIYNTK